MPKWFSRRLRSSRVWRLSMPSLRKKSSSGARVPAGTLKCLDASSRISWVVCSMVRMRGQFIIVTAGRKMVTAGRETQREELEQNEAAANAQGDGFGARACAELA